MIEGVNNEAGIHRQAARSGSATGALHAEFE
jgi:hypothetical protein